MFSVTLRLLSQLLQYYLHSQLSHTMLKVKRQHTDLPTCTATLLTQRFSHAERGKKKGGFSYSGFQKKKPCIPETLNIYRISVRARLAEFHPNLYFNLLSVQAAGLQAVHNRYALSYTTCFVISCSLKITEL